MKKNSKETALTKARSQLKKAEHANTPLSVKRKLKKRDPKKGEKV